MLWVVSCGVLGIAAWIDWNKRQIPNSYWRKAAYVVAPILALEFVLAPASILWRLAGVPFILAVLFLWRGQVYGGADAKGLIFLAITLSPSSYYAPLQARIFPAFDILIIAMLANEAWRRLRTTHTTPFFVPLAAATMLVAAFGCLAWWPFVWLTRFIV